VPTLNPLAARRHRGKGDRRRLRWRALASGRRVPPVTVALAFILGCCVGVAHGVHVASARGQSHPATLAHDLGRHPDCRFRGAKTAVPSETYPASSTPRAIHDSRARLFFYNNGESDFGSVYGCAFGVGRAVWLGPVDAEGSQGGGGIVGFALGDVFVITNSSQSGTNGPVPGPVQEWSAVAVVDLRSGHRLLRWRTPREDPNVKTVVVTPRGAAAWLNDGGVSWTLLASTAHGAVRTLESGSAETEPRSLSLVRGRLSWTSAGAHHSVRLS
jgi:hypothetical protein